MIGEPVIAVIDCGTNTFNLLIVKSGTETGFQKIYSDRIAVRLGESGINSGIIATEAYNRGIAALAEFSKAITMHGAGQVLAYATSAIRDAANGKSFTEQVYKNFGISLQVIDGEKEAELIYYGNRAAFNLGVNTSLIMDIGGGSNEFILCNNDTILWKQSFRIGAARLLEKFKYSNPITDTEINTVMSYLDEQLSDLFRAAKRFPPITLIGSSGAFDSIVEMIHGEFNGEPFSAEKTAYDVDIDQYQRIAGMVIAATSEQRRKIKGLIPIRVDMIVISCIMINHVLKRLNISKMRVSSYSLKEGALVEYIQNHVNQNGKNINN